MILRFDWIRNSYFIFFFFRYNIVKLWMYNLCGFVVIRFKRYWFRLFILYDDFFFVYYFVRGILYVYNLVFIVNEYGIDFF